MTLNAQKKLKFKFVPDRTLNAVLLSLPFVALFLKHILFVSFLFGDNYYEPNLPRAASGGIYYVFLQLAVIALMVAVTFCFRGNGRLIFAVCITLFTSALMLIDVCYVRYFNDLPSVSMAATNLFQNDDIEGGTSLVFPFVWQDFLFFVDYFIWGGVYFACRLTAKRRAKLISAAIAPTTADRMLGFGVSAGSIEFSDDVPSAAPVREKAEGDTLVRRTARRKSLIVASVLFAFAAIQLSLLPILHQVRALSGIPVYQNAFLSQSHRKQAIAFTSLGYHMYDIYKTIIPNKKLSEKEEKEIDAFYQYNTKNYHAEENFGAFKGKNMIFVQIESFEDFVLEHSVQGQEITPNLNKILSKSYRFNHIYDQVSTGNSSDCDLMTFTSMLPSSGVAAYKFYQNNTYHTLGEALRTAGYQSGYYMAHPGSYWGYQSMVEKSLAFDWSDFKFDLSDKIYNYISDGSMLTQFAERLPAKFAEGKAKGKNTYAHVVINNCHMPFKLPHQYNDLTFTGELNHHVLGNYLNAAHYSDKMIGEFLQTAEDTGLLENSVVVFMGDHRGIHKYNPHDINRLSDATYEDWFGRNFDSSQAFIVYDPAMNEGSGKIVETYGGQVDIMPTLLYLLGVGQEAYGGFAMGRALFAFERNATIGADEKIYGYPTDEDTYWLNQMYRLSNRMFQTDYFKTHNGTFVA